MTRLFTVLMLAMFSMGAWADVKVVYGEKGEDSYTWTGGKIAVSQRVDGTKVEVSMTVTPDKNYTITADDIYVYATISPNQEVTRGDEPEISRIILKDEADADPSKERTYTFSVESTFGLWVKEMDFKSSDSDSKRALPDDNVSFFYIQNQKDKSHYLYPSGDKDDSGNPYLKTDKKQDLSAVWMLIKNGSYYNLRHFSDGKYVITDDPTVKEKTVKLIDADDLTSYGDKPLFIIKETSEGSDVYTIMPKGASNNDGYNFLNPIGGVGKNIGLYTSDDQASQWKMIAVPAKPTFSRTDNVVSISAPLGDVWYKLDNQDISTDDATDPAVNNGTKEKSVTFKYGPKYTVRAIAAYNNNKYEPQGMWTSEVTVGTNYQVKVIAPNISATGNTITITSTQNGIKFKYSYVDGVNLKTEGTDYDGPFEIVEGSRYTVRAIAYNEVAGKTYYSEQESSIIVNLRGTKTINNFDGIDDATGSYVLSDNFTATGSPKNGIGSSSNPFKGTIDGQLKTINRSEPLFECIEDATIKNVILSGVNVSTSGNAGAIACEAKGDSRIFNCGILDGTVSGSTNVGGLVGLLDGSSRVINCFSYANITGGDKVGGIVGNNKIKTTTDSSKPATYLKTMVMNCMFYGDITGGTDKAPIYNGEIISNKDASGISNFNYFWGGASYVQNKQINTYNCALMAETRFLQRFEFFRHLLNSHRELAAWWATGSTANKDQMMKWVLEPSQIGSSTPYPILKTPGKYPSVVNIDAEHATTQTERNKGGLLGTLSVTINMGSGGAQFAPPTGASINTSTSSLTLNITDKDPDHFNFNYAKVQLPYYNDVGTGNYTGNCVVTGWKITKITGGTKGSFGTGDDATVDAEGKITAAPYNFADRNCTDKDLYSVSGRVFSQGAYWDVPEGVTAITIEPYWAKAAYLSDAYVDVVYDKDMNNAYNVPNVGGGQIYTNDKNYSIAGENQKVYTDIGNAANALGKHSDHSVYDYAIVLVGNYHKHNGISSSDAEHLYTIMSADFDHDNEPDYSYILRFNGRTLTHPVRVDFLNIPGLGMAQKSTTGTGTYNFGILIPKGWFESTNTSLFQFTQFEYEHKDRPATAPLILQGGVMEQWVSNSQNGISQKIPYYHVGGNVWFKEFHRGTHQDKQQSTKHPPISVTGGDYDEFYLTGLYRADFNSYNDNAECYINGGRFGIVAGTGMEGLGTSSDKGNIVWQIQNADIKEFYGGGINATKPAIGNITTVITGGYIKQFCGGPKFGNMNEGKTVVTTATGCKFDTYYGAGYGGNSYSRFTPSNINNINGDYGETKWNTFLNNNYKQEYNSTYGGVSTTFTTQYIPMSNNYQNVARLLIDFVSFSLATTRDVTSNLTGCTITRNFYGGGSLGKVDGPVTSTLTDCTVGGSVFGAGFSATLPTVEVMNTGGFTKAPYFDSNLGAYMAPTFPETVTYSWEHANTVNSTATAIDKDKHILYTTEDLTTLGTVTGKATLNIEGTTTVDGSVYGGGEESAVGGDTEVHVTGGTIGYANAPEYGAIVGNVYGGGKGLADNVTAGLVKGNTKVTIEGNTESPLIYHNIYGGGAFGSVGTYTYKNDGSIETYTKGGKCEVYVKGGQVGIDGHNNGMIFGSSRGDVSTPVGTPAIDPNDYLAWVHDTKVVIGDETKGTEQSGEGNFYDYPVIKGSVYGGGENGHTYQNTVVDIHSGMIGIVEIGLPDSERYTSRGNIYGGGCGTDTYDVSGKTYYNLNAGIVLGTTTVNIDGGHIARNVYGAGSMGSVGTFTLDDDNTNNILDGKPVESKNGTGVCNVNISGGMIGNPGAKMHYDDSQTGPDDFGHVFGAGRGETRDSTDYVNLNIVGYVKETHVTISNKAFITGSVYGGSESGHVLKDTYVTIQGGQIGCGEGETGPYTDWTATSLKETAHWPYSGSYSPYDKYSGDTGYDLDAAKGGSKKATNGHTFNGNVFGGGSGYYPYAPGKWVRSAGLVEGNTNVTITGGHILSNVYGGNEHTDVYGKCTVNISGGTVGVPLTYAEKLAHPVTGNVFGAGKGDKRVLFNTWTNVKETEVNVSGGTIYGGVFGGGEDGHVLGNAKTTIKETDPTNMPTIIGTLGTTGYDGNVYGGGRGSYTALTAGVVCGNTEVNIEGGLMMGSVYGGGRLASVGTHLVPPTASGNDQSEHKYYGKLIEDGKKQTIWKYADNNPDNDEDEEAEGVTHGHTVIKITGGKIGYDKAGNLISSSFSTGDVFGACKGTTNGEFGTVEYNNAQTTLGVSKSSLVNLLGGTVGNSIYGGGELGNIGTAGSAETFFAKINLLGGQVKNVYGGGLGQKAAGSTPAAKTLVMGDVKVNLNGLETDDYVDAGSPSAIVTPVDKDGTEGVDFYRVPDDQKGCVVTGNIFGCNNANGTPTGHAKVHVFATQNADKTQINEKDEGQYDVAAVYGGGNQADYIPYQANATDQKTEVIIEGCDRTSIKEVYGGGNAAATPGTLVRINGTKIIENVFGGGNGMGSDNPGANIGFRTDASDTEYAEYKDNGNYIGDGKATVELMAGTVVNAYGGSNTKGNIRGGSYVNTVQNVWSTGRTDCCKDLHVTQIYGGGNNADMLSGASIVMGCTTSNSWIEEIYAGAKNANVGGNVSLTLTSGKYGRVFGGNKESGILDGTITVNIEENGVCGIPLIIGELYGGGNKAAYSIYGYNADGNPLTSGESPKASPVVNVRAFTSIGNIFGGGYGEKAVMYGSPTVNINEVEISHSNLDNVYANGYAGETLYFVDDVMQTTKPSGGVSSYDVTLPNHENGKKGAINNIFGGGNAAKVFGNTNVNIGTEATQRLVKLDDSGNPLYQTDGVTPQTEEMDVVGADIRGNVYGGGNAAEVTGNTNVVIGKDGTTTTTP